MCFFKVDFPCQRIFVYNCSLKTVKKLTYITYTEYPDAQGKKIFVLQILFSKE